MVAFGHSSVGAIIGASVAVVSAPTTNPFYKIAAALIFGVISHYVFDAIPHGHYDFDTKKLRRNKLFWVFLLDTIGAFTVLSLVALTTIGTSLTLLLVVAGMVGALLPDIWEAFIELKIIPTNWVTKAHSKFHYSFLHWHNQPHSHLKKQARMLSLTDIWQVITFIIAMLLLSTLPKA